MNNSQKPDDVLSKQGYNSRDESDDLKSDSTLQLVSLLTSEDEEMLRGFLLESITQAASERRGAKAAQGMGLIGPDENPVRQSLLSGLTEGLDYFLDNFFESHPDLDSTKKTEILNHYMKGFTPLVDIIVNANNPRASRIAEENLVENYKDALKNNPKLRGMQLVDIMAELEEHMNKAGRMRTDLLGADGKRVERQHGGRESWQNGLGVSVIVLEALVTGFAMSNGIENEAFVDKNSLISQFQSLFGSWSPGMLGAGLTAIGGQMWAKAFFKNKGKNRPFAEQLKLATGGIMLATALSTIAIGDYTYSKSAIGVGAATSGAVKNRANEMNIKVQALMTENQNHIIQSKNDIANTTTILLEKEDKNRGGKAGFYALKSRIMNGSLDQSITKYNSSSKIDEWMKTVDENKGTNLSEAYVTFRNAMGMITYSNNIPLQVILANPDISLKDKLTGVEKESELLWNMLSEKIGSLEKRASAHPNLDFETMIKPSKIGAFSSGPEARSAIRSVVGDITRLKEQIEALKTTTTDLTKVYIDGIKAVEKIAGIALVSAKHPDWKDNKLPENMNLDLQIPDTDPIATLANSPLGDFRGMSANEAMVQVQSVYGKGVLSKVDSMIMKRAGIFVGFLLIVQLGLLFSSYHRRSKNHNEIEAVGKECMNQVGVIVDTLYAWVNEGFGKVVSRPNGEEIMSRAYCEHIVWSWLIDTMPALREFAPVTYLGKKKDTNVVLEYFKQLITCDIRPDTDRRTEALFKIFSQRANDGVLMTAQDIDNIKNQMNLGDGNDIVERIKILSEKITASNIEYARISSKNPEDAKYIENARQSRMNQEKMEIEAAKKISYSNHIVRLQNLADDLANDTLGLSDTEIPTQINEILQKIKIEQTNELKEVIQEIKARYQVSQETKPTHEKPTDSFIDGAISWIKNIFNKNNPNTLSHSSDFDDDILRDPTTPQTIKALTPTALKGNMGTISANLANHATWIKKLQQPTGKADFIKNVLGKSYNGIDAILNSVDDIQKYRDLMSGIEGYTLQVNAVRDALKGTDSLESLHSGILNMANILEQRRMQIKSEGHAFETWVKNITHLIAALDAIEGHDKNWNEGTVKTPTKPIKTLTPRKMALGNIATAIRAVAEKKSQESSTESVIENVKGSVDDQLDPESPSA